MGIVGEEEVSTHRTERIKTRLGGSLKEGSRKEPGRDKCEKRANWNDNQKRNVVSRIAKKRGGNLSARQSNCTPRERKKRREKRSSEKEKTQCASPLKTVIKIEMTGTEFV